MNSNDIRMWFEDQYNTQKQAEKVAKQVETVQNLKTKYADDCAFAQTHHYS